MSKSEIAPCARDGSTDQDIADSGVASDGLPRFGFIRLRQLLDYYPISRSQVYVLVGTGRLPAFKLNPAVTVFDVADVRALRTPISTKAEREIK